MYKCSMISSCKQRLSRNKFLFKQQEDCIVQDLRAEVFVGRKVAVEGVCHEVVGERKMFCDVFNRPRVKVQVQQALVTAIETANLPSKLEQLRERLQTRPTT